MRTKILVSLLAFGACIVSGVPFFNYVPIHHGSYMILHAVGGT